MATVNYFNIAKADIFIHKNLMNTIIFIKSVTYFYAE